MSEFVTKDSGERIVFENGGQRDTSAGKGLYCCLPPEGIDRLAKLMERGAIKYNLSNYRKGIKLSRYLDSALRHLFQFTAGENTEDHLAATAFNVLCLIQTEKDIADKKLPDSLDDLNLVRTGQTKEQSATESDPWKNEKPQDYIGIPIFHPTEQISNQDAPTPEAEKERLARIDKEFIPEFTPIGNLSLPKNTIWCINGKQYRNVTISAPFKKQDYEPFYVGTIEGELDPNRIIGTKELNEGVDSYNKILTDVLDKNKDSICRYDELRGITPEQLKNHPIYKVLAPILKESGFIHQKVDQVANLKNKAKELDWKTFSEAPQPNRELICLYDVKQLQQFSPNFPVAKYALCYANTIDKSLFTHWAYLSGPFDQNLDKEDKKFDELEKAGLIKPIDNFPKEPKIVDYVRPIKEIHINEIGKTFGGGINKHLLPPKKEVLAVTQDKTTGEIKQAVFEDGKDNDKAIDLAPQSAANEDFYRWRATIRERPNPVANTYHNFVFVSHYNDSAAINIINKVKEESYNNFHWNYWRYPKLTEI